MQLPVLDLIARANERVRLRLKRTIEVLEALGRPYAIVGDHAVAAWIESIDESAVRNPVSVEILVTCNNWLATKEALECDGFLFNSTSGKYLFYDEPDQKSRNAVQVFVSEVALCVRDLNGFSVLEIEPLAQRLLGSYRTVDRMHLRDMIGVGLIDESWLDKVPVELAPRLKQILDDPEG